MATNIQPMPNVGSQIERAIIAYLKFAFGADASKYNFYFSNDWADRVPPLIDVLAHRSNEDTVNSREESYQVKIEFEWPGTNQPGTTNLDINWVSINQVIGVVMEAMSQTDSVTDINRVSVETAKNITKYGRLLAIDQSNGADQTQVLAAKNNCDMPNFTCQHVKFSGSVRGIISNNSIFLKEMRNFEIRACPFNID